VSRKIYRIYLLVGAETAGEMRLSPTIYENPRRLGTSRGMSSAEKRCDDSGRGSIGARRLRRFTVSTRDRFWYCDRVPRFSRPCGINAARLLLLGRHARRVSTGTWQGCLKMSAFFLLKD